MRHMPGLSTRAIPSCLHYIFMKQFYNFRSFARFTDGKFTGKVISVNEVHAFHFDY